MRRMVWGLLAVAVSGCQTIQEEPAPMPAEAMQVDEAQIVAQVGDILVTREEALQELRQLTPLLQRQFKTPRGKEEFLRSIVDKKLLAAEVRTGGLADKTNQVLR